MKKTKNAYLKLLAILIATVLTTGCVSIIHQYSPRRTSGWKTYGWKHIGSRNYKYECNGAEVGVYPLKIYPVGGDKPSLAIDIYNPKGQEACELSFLWLENTKTGQRMNPINVETLYYNDKMTTVCSYSFDIHGDKNVQYNLHISDLLLGCPIDPIPYVFEKTWEIPFQEVM